MCQMVDSFPIKIVKEFISYCFDIKMYHQFSFGTSCLFFFKITIKNIYLHKLKTTKKTSTSASHKIVPNLFRIEMCKMVCTAQSMA